MIYLGTDIVPISRIENMINKKGDHFLNHIFTQYEQKICNAKEMAPIHYSGKFAAKEAVKKALLTSRILNNISLKSIEIRNDGLGAPLIILINNFVSENNSKLNIYLKPYILK